MSVELRPYQLRAIAELRAQYAAGKRAPCLVLPTGGGKTRIAAAIMRAAVDRGNPSLFLAHRRELITQTVEKLADAGVTDVRVIRADEDSGNRDAPVTVASIPTLATKRWRDRLPDAALVIPDEAHHQRASSHQRLTESYPRARLLGLTATPQRGDGRALGDMFDSIVVGATVRELTELGHLVPLRAWAPPEALESGKLASTPLEAYLAHAEGRRTVVFCATVEHATSVAAEFCAAGVPAGVVHGEMPARLRDDVLARFRAGELRVVVNVNVLTEGWDDPGCAVAILARRIQHEGAFLQVVGRVLRPEPGKTEALLIDLCGSVLVHGLPIADRTFTLDGTGISKAERDRVRQCPTCGAVFPPPRRPICPQCGAELPRQERKQQRAGRGELVDVTERAAQRHAQLRANLAAAARRGHHSDAWISRAFDEISSRRFAWR